VTTTARGIERSIVIFCVTVAALVTAQSAADAQDPGVTIGTGAENAYCADDVWNEVGTARDESPAPSASEQQPGNEDPPKKKKTKKNGANTTQDGVALHLGKHPSLSIGSSVKLELKARLQGDVRLATPDIGLDGAQPEWNDRRIGIEGKAFKKIEFEVARELGDDFETKNGLNEKTSWRDVYANVRLTKTFQVEAGRFKLPFGREELTGETNRDFVYRSLAARVLSPGRDTGAMVHGQIAGRLVGYQIGYFTRDGDNGRTNSTEGGHEGFAGRLVAKPFEHLSSATFAPLQVGVAAADSRLDDQLGLRGRTVLGDGVLFDRVYVNGRRKRLGFEAEWAKGPVSLSTEYVSVSDERKGMGFGGEDLPDVRSSAWYVASTWSLIGESRHARLEPLHELRGGGFGAVELAVRIEALRFEDISYPGSVFGFPNPSSLPSNADRVTTVGVNWYLNRYLKAQTNFVIESIEDPQRSPAPASGGRFVSGIVRLQLAL
jgi:phosphate-selective porin OprO/OprP